MPVMSREMAEREGSPMAESVGRNPFSGLGSSPFIRSLPMLLTGPAGYAFSVAGQYAEDKEMAQRNEVMDIIQGALQGNQDPVRALQQAVQNNPRLLAQTDFATVRENLQQLYSGKETQRQFLHGPEGAIYEAVPGQEELKQLVAGTPELPAFLREADAMGIPREQAKQLWIAQHTEKGPAPDKISVNDALRLRAGGMQNTGNPLVDQMTPEQVQAALRAYQTEGAPDTPVDASGALKPAFSNAIRGSVARIFGGVWDPISGEISGLNPEDAANSVVIESRAAQLLREGKELSAPEAALRAARESGIDVGAPEAFSSAPTVGTPDVVMPMPGMAAPLSSAPTIPAPGPAPAQGDNIPLVKTQADYDALPVGASYRTVPGGPVYPKVQ